jgi:hypothetical protein
MLYGGIPGYTVVEGAFVGMRTLTEDDIPPDFGFLMRSDGLYRDFPGCHYLLL